MRRRSRQQCRNAGFPRADQLLKEAEAKAREG
jgi:hypothetical protein